MRREQHVLWTCVKEKVSLTVCCVVTQDNKKEDKILREEITGG